MTEPKIEKNVPVPPRGSYGRWVVLISKMSPGDSVILTRNEYTNFYTAARREGYRATSRTENGKLRVWLTAKGD